MYYVALVRSILMHTDEQLGFTFDWLTDWVRAYMWEGEWETAKHIVFPVCTSTDAYVMRYIIISTIIILCEYDLYLDLFHSHTHSHSHARSSGRMDENTEMSNCQNRLSVNFTSLSVCTRCVSVWPMRRSVVLLTQRCLYTDTQSLQYYIFISVFNFDVFISKLISFGNSNKIDFWVNPSWKGTILIHSTWNRFVFVCWCDDFEKNRVEFMSFSCHTNK